MTNPWRIWTVSLLGSQVATAFVPNHYSSFLSSSSSSRSIHRNHHHPKSYLNSSNDWSGNQSSQRQGGGRLIEIEYKVYPGGRVEEVVTGVKGGNCHKVTEQIEAALGEVIATQPTEEMYENEINLTNKETLKNTNGWEDSGSSGQFSSW